MRASKSTFVSNCKWKRFLAVVMLGSSVLLFAQSSAGGFQQNENRNENRNETLPSPTVSLDSTITNLSIEWKVAGDQNNDGKVAVRYRKVGEEVWNKGMDLFRVPAGELCGHDWENKQAGSLFGLDPGTEYEVELSLSDPDGGDSVKTARATTRSWPVSATEGKLVNPDTIDQAIKELAAGDVLVLADGTYGEVSIQTDGTEQSPVVIRAENIGGAVVNADVYMKGRQHVHVVGLTVNGKIKFNDAQDIVVRQCNVTTERDGIVSYGEESARAVVVGNTVSGPSKWNELALWVQRVIISVKGSC